MVDGDPLYPPSLRSVLSVIFAHALKTWPKTGLAPRVNLVIIYNVMYRGYKTIPPLRLGQIHNNSKLELLWTNWSTIPIFEIVIDTISNLKLWGFFGGALRAPYWNCFIWNCLRNLWEQFPILKLYSKVTTTIPTIEIYDKARVLHKSFCEW